MELCTLINLIQPGTCILVSPVITLESETLLRNGSVPENDGNRGECNEVGEAISGLSPMDMNPSPSRHFPITGVTGMII